MTALEMDAMGKSLKVYYDSLPPGPDRNQILGAIFVIYEKLNAALELPF